MPAPQRPGRRSRRQAAVRRLPRRRSAPAEPGRGQRRGTGQARRGWLLAPSGADARLSIHDASRTGHLRRLASIGTRPWAHNMAYDADHGIAYLPSMDDTEVYPADGGESQRHFTADSFTVTALRLREARP